MAFEWFMAFDHLPEGATGANWAAGDGALSRSGGHANVRVVDIGGEHRLGTNQRDFLSWRKNVPNLSRIVCGMRWRIAGTGGLDRSSQTQLALFSGGTLGLNLWREHTTPRWDLRFGTTTLASNILAEVVNTDFYIELSAEIDSVNGSVEVRVDGVPIPATQLSGINTGPGPVTVVEGPYGFASDSNMSRAIYSSAIYIRERPEAQLGFRGPLTFERLDLDSDEAVQWDRSTGATNYERLTGVADTDEYVESDTLDEVDEYGVESTVGANSIVAVVGYAVSEAPDGGAPQIQVGLKRGENTEYVDPRTVGVGAPGTQMFPYLTQPDGSGWSIAAVNELNALLKAS